VCTRCGSFGCADCVFSAIEKREVCKACGKKGLGEPIPWERRKEIGSFRAYWQTVTLASRSPSLFFRTPPTQKSVVGAVAHGVLSSMVGLLVSYLISGTLLVAAGGLTAVFVQDNAAEPLGLIMGAYGCVILGISPIALALAIPNTLMSLVFSAAGAHGILALFKKTKVGFEETLRAVSYANAPHVLSGIPVLGLVAYVWMIGVEVIALREIHRCGTDWAAAAAIGYRVVTFGVFFVLYAGLFGMMFALETAQR
jgi:hypothetical protein